MVSAFMGNNGTNVNTIDQCRTTIHSMDCFCKSKEQSVSDSNGRCPSFASIKELSDRYGHARPLSVELNDQQLDVESITGIIGVPKQELYFQDCMFFHIDPMSIIINRYGKSMKYYRNKRR